MKATLLIQAEKCKIVTAELHWLKHVWNHEKKFEIGIVRTNEC